VTTTKGRKPFQQVTSNAVCRTYELLHSKNLISFPITAEAREKVDALVTNISRSYWEKEIYPSHELKAVAYLYFLIKDHPFTDGNKRTASLVFSIVCDINELSPNYSEAELDEIAVFIEKVQEADHQSVIQILASVLFER